MKKKKKTTREGEAGHDSSVWKRQQIAPGIKHLLLSDAKFFPERAFLSFIGFSLSEGMVLPLSCSVMQGRDEPL